MTMPARELDVLPATQSPVVLHTQAISVNDLLLQIQRIQEAMSRVMKLDVHYGIIPGTKRPSLWKPGAEVLASMFRLAVSYETTDLSGPDEIRYRVRAILTHQTSGIVVGEGMGECSSSEEKYKWRRAICDEEWNDTPQERRRLKYSKYGSKVQKQQQVRQEPADLANTILKIACKRAQIAGTLNVTAASDCFAQREKPQPGQRPPVEAEDDEEPDPELDPPIDDSPEPLPERPDPEKARIWARCVELATRLGGESVARDIVGSWPPGSLNAAKAALIRLQNADLDTFYRDINEAGVRAQDVAAAAREITGIQDESAQQALERLKPEQRAEAIARARREP